jgi:hypothetical protein
MRFERPGAPQQPALAGRVAAASDDNQLLRPHRALLV